MGLFRHFRNDLSPQEDPNAPLSDFFFSDSSELERITSSDLNIGITADPATFRAELARFAEANAPALVPRLTEVAGETYADVLLDLLRLLVDVYGDEATVCPGFKQTWAEAFIAPILNTFPNARCLHVIRDPRAMIASWKITDDLTYDYPFLMMIRHWRKSVALANLFSRKYPDAYSVVRYEDFVSAPEECVADICGPCGVPFAAETTEVSGFRSGDNAAWSTNTSYDSADSGAISTQFVSRWHERLSEREVALIETLCAPELKCMGYGMETDGDPNTLVDPPTMARDTRGETRWIDAYSDAYAFNLDNQGRELSRWFIFRNRESGGIPSMEVEALRRAFIDPDLVPCRAFTYPDLFPRRAFIDPDFAPFRAQPKVATV